MHAGLRETDLVADAILAASVVLLDQDRRLREMAAERPYVEYREHEAGARFHLLADNVGQFAWIADETGGLTWYNQRWYDYTGSTLQKMQGWGWQTVHHPYHVERVVERLRHAFETGDAREDTFPLRRWDGQYRWFLSRALPVRDEQGRITRWFGTHTDVTEQSETEARFRFVTQTGRLGVWEHDIQTKAQIASTTAKQNFGHDPAAPFTYQDVRDSIHPHDRDRVTAAFDHSVASGADYDVEYRIIRPGGKAGWLEVRAQVIRAVDGTASGLAGV